jgi:drug/metabolite transporter (DMT)-like permease
VTNHKKGIWLVFVGVVFMSIESPLIKFSALPPLTIALFYGLSIVLSTNLLLISKGKAFFIKSYVTDTKGTLLSGMFFGLSNICFIAAVYYGGISKTVLILASTPIISALVAFFVLKQHTPMRIFIATFFVFIGLYIILADDLNSHSLVGNLFAFACVLSISSLFCTLSLYTQASRLGYISFGGMLVVLFSVWGANLSVNFFALLPIFLLGLLITPLSRFLIGIGTKYVIPAEVGLLFVVESILAPIWGYLLLDEQITASSFVGGSIILFALILNSLASMIRR